MRKKINSFNPSEYMKMGMLYSVLQIVKKNEDGTFTIEQVIIKEIKSGKEITNITFEIGNGKVDEI